MANRYYTLISALPNLDKRSLPSQQHLLELIGSELYEADYQLGELIIQNSFPNGSQNSIQELELNQTLLQEAITRSSSELLHDWLSLRHKLRLLQISTKDKSKPSSDIPFTSTDLYLELTEVFDGITLDALVRDIHPAEGAQLEKQLFFDWLQNKAFNDVFSLDAVYNYLLRYAFLWEENSPSPDWKSKLLQAEILNI